ncbi:hypothetical protein LIER_25810 [Lithospermum erythrorhizon]|uniref:MULE transposase domain-containing protein n=1 Tax=Lithospermum erythrorhizon TaxID=34254 RepID=A0AAV3R650_LITER
MCLLGSWIDKQACTLIQESNLVVIQWVKEWLTTLMYRSRRELEKWYKGMRILVFNEGGESVFQRWYLCWSACRDGFVEGCTKLVGVDGYHLKSKFSGQLLVVVGLDPKNNIFPITYAIVKVENKQSWEWFLTHLDEDKGLIEEFKTVMPKVEHRFCVRHLHENFKRTGYKAETYKDALRTSTTSSTVQYFKEAMGKLKVLDTSAYEWLAEKEPVHWSRAYLTTSATCDVLLNNMC